tara:strand:- start:18 stop:308 length:291 start_codon:yes stop_codon:yes gene_type:complete
MEFIELKSVGSLVTNLGDVHPTSDIDNKIAGEGVNIFECSDEWYWSLGLVDGFALLNFMDKYIGWYEGSQIHDNYEQWKEKVKGLMGRPDTLVEVV